MKKLGICEPSVFVATGHLYLTSGSSCIKQKGCGMPFCGKKFLIGKHFGGGGVGLAKAVELFTCKFSFST